MKTKIVFILSYISVLSGCSSTSRISDLRNEKGKIQAHHVSYDASRRGSLIFTDDKGKMIVISEPPPDVATKLATELGAKADVMNKVNAELYLQTTKSIAELGKRTSAVNILRDALYKLTELKLNNDTIDDRTFRLFNEILDVAKNVSYAELQSEMTETAKAETEKSKAKAQEAILTNSVVSLDNEKAQQLENQAFDSLLDKKYDAAKEKFKEIDTIFPSYHSAYEIYRYLKSIENQNLDQKSILKEIYKKYVWKIPLKYQIEMKKIINE
ncbi:hypothetical protein [uncultured Chryseobacterium sp.]|uniref:hypothetical protein n=1 Tax=uncultured Chryseobacterium sp. TaxID=259322 RepID=UPI0025F7A308|nr:hypothetical protein [uncultured Chryseobacterium sp.]